MDSKNAKYNTEQVLWKRETYSQCEGCKYAEKDYEVHGKVIAKGCDKGFCQKYPKAKPYQFSDLSEKKTQCQYKSK